MDHKILILTLGFFFFFDKAEKGHNVNLKRTLHYYGTHLSSSNHTYPKYRSRGDENQERDYDSTLEKY